MRLESVVVLVAMVASTWCAEEKRAASMGFMGMRGKKDDFLDSEGSKTEDMSESGFVGPLGGFGADIDQLYKRGGSSMGFMGMRGKKDDFLDKRARTMGFVGMKGKKDNDATFDDNSRAFLDFQDNPEKRGRNTNTLGFSGMRGKKDSFDAEDNYFEKRAPGSNNNLGFNGMRGKKDTDGFQDWEDSYGKRTRPNSMSGFVGMRGKKDWNQGDKRGPSGSSFFGMRGKKAPGSSSFVGMRGKKDDENTLPNIDMDNMMAYLMSPDAARDRIVTFRSKRFLSAPHWAVRNSKKAPLSGFIGLRGKKSFHMSPESQGSPEFVAEAFSQ